MAAGGALAGGPVLAPIVAVVWFALALLAERVEGEGHGKQCASGGNQSAAPGGCAGQDTGKAIEAVIVHASPQTSGRSCRIDRGGTLART